MFRHLCPARGSNWYLAIVSSRYETVLKLHSSKKCFIVRQLILCFTRFCPGLSLAFQRVQAEGILNCCRLFSRAALCSSSCYYVCLFFCTFNNSLVYSLFFCICCCLFVALLFRSFISFFYILYCMLLFYLSSVLQFACFFLNWFLIFFVFYCISLFPFLRYFASCFHSCAPCC